MKIRIIGTENKDGAKVFSELYIDKTLNAEDFGVKIAGDSLNIKNLMTYLDNLPKVIRYVYVHFLIQKEESEICHSLFEARKDFLGRWILVK